MRKALNLSQIQALYCFLIFVLVFLLYWPGLTGSYLLDDFTVLGAIESHRGLASWQDWKSYLFGGTTGPGGRPLSLLSFGLNASAWPNDPWIFLAGNVLMHAVNALLWWFFLRYFLRQLLPSQQASFVSGMAVLLWVMSPFQVASVLYIVQRMTLLSCLFLVISLLGYWWCRVAACEHKFRLAFAWAAIIAMAAVFGFYSKENMVLLPLQIMLVELCLRMRAVKSSRLVNVAVWWCLLPLCLLVVGYLCWMFAESVKTYSETGLWPTHARAFNTIERLYTQQSVVGNYLLGSLLPKVSEAGVFFDGVVIQKSFWSWSVCGWFIVHLGLSIGAVLLSKRHPVIFFGVFWFYISHLLESSVVMLELRFDHRNYIPSIGIFVVVAYVISFIPRKLTRYGVAGVLIAANAVVLFFTTALWGKPLEAAVVWMEKNPESNRAVENAARKFLSIGYDQEAKKLLKKSIKQAAQPASELRYIMAFCETYNDRPVDWQGLSDRVEKGSRDWSLYVLFESILEQKESGECGLIELNGYLSLLQAYRKNPTYAGNLSVMAMDELEVRAAIAFKEIDLAKKMQQQHRSLLLPLAYKMNIALAFASEGEVDFAVQVLDVGIQVAEQLDNESQYVLNDAKEILDLMLADLKQEN